MHKYQYYLARLKSSSPCASRLQIVIFVENICHSDDQDQHHHCGHIHNHGHDDDAGGGESDFGHLHSPLPGCVPAACLKNLGKNHDWDDDDHDDHDDDDDDDGDGDGDGDHHDGDADYDACSLPPPSCCR